MRKPLLSPAAVVAVLSLTAAQANASQAPAYTLTDVGTFGGAQTQFDGPGTPLTNQGTVIGTSDTTIADSDVGNTGPYGSDPQLTHAFAWQNGKITDLGALPGNNSSAVFEITQRGVGAGSSETTPPDPLTGAPAQHPVEFDSGKVLDLGTLPGGTEGFALAINDRGQIAGLSNNGTADPIGFPAFYPWVTQVRSFIWQDGVMRDLGTLGGPDTVMTTMNARGQIAGDSYTNNTPTATTGVPAFDPFLWTDGQMRDLGTLGGTQSTTSWLNDSGEVVGQDNVAGDQSYHPFLWDGRRLRDLGTFGGNFGNATHINNAGEVIGWAMTPAGGIAHAFLWNNGKMTDLTGARSTQCTFAEWNNNTNQVVGGACDGSAGALLWSNGSQYDLNSLIGPSDVRLTEAVSINDRGDIAALGTLPDRNEHVFLLHPTVDQTANPATNREISQQTRHAAGAPPFRSQPRWSLGVGLRVQPRFSTPLP